MTKLTTESLEKFVNDIKTDGMCDITDYQVALALRQLLAYEQAAKNPIGSFHISDGKVEATTDYCRDGEWPVQDGEVLVYAAPVLPKQPEPEPELKIGTSKHDNPYYIAQCRSCGWLGSSEDCLGDEESCDCPLCHADAGEVDAETTFNVMLDAINELRASTAQPVMAEQCEVSKKRLEVIGYGSIPASIDEQRSMARTLLSAQPVSEPSNSPVIPDAYVLDELGRMTLNGVCEPRVSFGSGWNACRAEMLKAQPVSEPYKLPQGYALVPLEPTAAMFHAFNDCDYGRKSMRERYIQMIEAAPARECSQ